MTKIFQGIIFIIIQFVLLLVTLLGYIYSVVQTMSYAKKEGVSMTATSVLGGRWIMHVFGTREDEANLAVIEAVEQIRREHQSAGEFGLHWMGGAFYRLYGLFGPGEYVDRRLPYRPAQPQYTRMTEATWMYYANPDTDRQRRR